MNEAIFINLPWYASLFHAQKKDREPAIAAETTLSAAVQRMLRPYRNKIRVSLIKYMPVDGEYLKAKGAHLRSHSACLRFSQAP